MSIDAVNGSSIGQPRGDAHERQLRAAAREFEGLFVQMMLKSMRATEFGSDLMGDGQAGAYRDMLDQKFAAEVGGANGLGIADMLVQQLRANAAARAETPASPPEAPAASPEDFVSRVRPAAERAAAELGVPARVLVAQAALETGWGRAAEDNNLFGIKADARWQGASRESGTHEYVAGERVETRAAFRAYASPEESFRDYVAFLRENPRYAEALAHGGDHDVFLERLQRAGYATDPAYADKIRGIADSELLTRAWSGRDRAGAG